MPGRGSKGKIVGGRASGILVLDVVDDLGHVVFVLAEFRGVLDQFLVFLLALCKRHRLVLILDRFGLLHFEIGIEILAGHRCDLALDRRCRPRPAGLQERLRIERGVAFRADDLLPHQIIIAGAATRADTLGAPFGFRHRLLLGTVSEDHRRQPAAICWRAIATAAAACQKQRYRSGYRLGPTTQDIRRGYWPAWRSAAAYRLVPPHRQERLAPRRRRRE